MSDLARFDALWRRVFKSSGETTFAALHHGYASPARTYHNWAHVDAMLAGMDRALALQEFSGLRRDEVELAIWFHDAIYDPLAKTNEADSAQLFRHMAGSDEAPELCGRVVAMIGATAMHGPTDDLETRLLLDLDLAVLGSSPANYAGYVERVRREYSAVPEEAWRAGRPEVLRRFLDRRAIYQTRYFFDALEAAARRNIAAEIDQLTRE